MYILNDCKYIDNNNKNKRLRNILMLNNVIVCRVLCLFHYFR